MRSLSFTPLAALALACMVSCAASSPRKDDSSQFVLGTICTITLYEFGTPAIYAEIFSRLTEIENRMSANKDGTEIAAVNASAGSRPEKVSSDTMLVLVTALKYAELTDGAFDPSIGPLVKLWGIGTDAAHVPSEGEIKNAQSLINWKDIVADKGEGTVFLKREGMRLDLGAIAKGYAADECAKIIVQRKIPRAIINLGGNVFALGEKKDGSPWRVGIQNPDGLRDSFFAIAKVRNQTLVTSGTYERFFEHDGKRYHHILDPKTGYPAETGLKSSTIITKSSIDADALSTSLFLLGPARGMALAKKLGGFDAILVDSSDNVMLSENASIDITDEKFRIQPKE